MARAPSPLAESPTTAAPTRICNLLHSEPSRAPSFGPTLDLNLAAIKPLVGWFHGLEEEHDTPWPKKYHELPDQPLQFGAVRLLVVPLDNSPEVLRFSAMITADIMRLLPDHAKVCGRRRGVAELRGRGV